MLVSVLIARQGAPEGPDDIDAASPFVPSLASTLASSSPLLRLHPGASVTLASLNS